jgi:hypothetical protein
MARKRYNEEDILRLLREIYVHSHDGLDTVSSSLLHPSLPLFAKKRKSMPSPPLWEAGLVFDRGPTPTSSCRHRP